MFIKFAIVKSLIYAQLVFEKYDIKYVEMQKNLDHEEIKKALSRIINNMFVLKIFTPFNG